MSQKERSCFQAYLERLSDYLLCGEDIWWRFERNSQEIVFHDGFQEPDNRNEGPEFMSFVDTQLSSLAGYLDSCWQKCIETEKEQPIEYIKVFDSQGDFMQIKNFLYTEVQLTNQSDIPTIALDDEIENVDPTIEILPQGNCIDNLDFTVVDQNVLPSQQNNNVKPETEENTNSEEKITYISLLSSSTAKSIYFLIGESDLLKKFDKNHILFKENKKKNSR